MLGYDGLIKILKMANYKPIKIERIERNKCFSITAPNLKRNRKGKVVLELPDEVFNNNGDNRSFNKGKTKVLLLYIEEEK